MPKYFAAIDKRTISQDRKVVWGVGKTKDSAVVDARHQVRIAKKSSPGQEPSFAAVEVTKDLYDYVKFFVGKPRRYIKSGNILDLTPHDKRGLNQFRKDFPHLI